MDTSPPTTNPGSPRRMVAPVAALSLGVLMAAVSMAVVSMGVVSMASPVAAATSSPPASELTLTGHGFGHGHGMGQWGALGYALEQTTYQSIVAHFYGGTTLSPLSSAAEASEVGVTITENDNNSVIVTSDSPFTAAGLSVGAGQAVLMTNNGTNGSWNVIVGGGCAGPWNGSEATNVTAPVAVPSDNPGLGNPNAANLALQLCQGGTGGNITMRGEIEATDDQGQARTVDIVPLEEYVAGVVPNESPSYWGTIGSAGPQGEPWGFQELEAQAVAVRSYVMAGASSAGGYVAICDSTECQSYRGIQNESPIADLAVTDTAGEVMEFAGGQVASTQYSASTGGYTDPGVNSLGFPAVPDAGDSICTNQACNPYHDWTTSVPLSQIETTWPQLGTFEALDVTARNGYGDWGGRVTSLTLVGSVQNVSMTGDAFAAAMGLLSDWFTTTTPTSTTPTSTTPTSTTPTSTTPTSTTPTSTTPTTPTSTTPTSTTTTTTTTTTPQPNQPIVGMAATPDGKGYWLVGSDGGIFSYGDATFYGSTGGMTLNRPIVGMAATPDGKGYWLVASDGGIFSYGDASFYGSTGGMTLNRPVVGMAVSPGGSGYWLVASDGGIFAFGDATFYGSTGAIVLNKPVVGMSASADGHGYRLVASDGGIFSFGDAPFYGSTGGRSVAAPVVGMSATPDGAGYWIVGSNGSVLGFGDAGSYGPSPSG